MKKELLEMIEKRRSIYDLGSRKVLSEERISEIVKEAVKYCPTAFNSQSARVVVLFGENHQKLWDIVLQKLKEVAPQDGFAKTELKIASFAAGYATILFFEDLGTVEDLQKKFPLYAENFSKWSLQANGMLEYIVWAALEAEDAGASLQHYNPLIDDDVKKTWNLPQKWQLLAQMPVGSIEAPAGDKSFLPIDERVKIFK